MPHACCTGPGDSLSTGRDLVVTMIFWSTQVPELHRRHAGVSENGSLGIDNIKKAGPCQLRAVLHAHQVFHLSHQIFCSPGEQLSPTPACNALQSFHYLFTCIGDSLVRPRLT